MGDFHGKQERVDLFGVPVTLVKLRSLNRRNAVVAIAHEQTIICWQLIFRSRALLSANEKEEKIHRMIINS